LSYFSNKTSTSITSLSRGWV